MVLRRVRGLIWVLLGGRSYEFFDSVAAKGKEP
jgi:hypothetical protein